jgi:alkanesulfonate monooxygenase SsuD/methylene tetrahydromethanopterin reductase-like flavin-dependent oxidoreductase (luciferase family)
VTNKFCGSRAATEEGTMILVNSKDVVAGRIQDIQAQAAAAGRRPHGRRPRRGARRTLAALPGVRVLARTA